MSCGWIQYDEREADHYNHANDTVRRHLFHRVIKDFQAILKKRLFSFLA